MCLCGDGGGFGRVHIQSALQRLGHYHQSARISLFVCLAYQSVWLTVARSNWSTAWRERQRPFPRALRRDADVWHERRGETLPSTQDEECECRRSAFRLAVYLSGRLCYSAAAFFFLKKQPHDIATFLYISKIHYVSFWWAGLRDSFRSSEAVPDCVEAGKYFSRHRCW